jgi:Mg-chelatase subunit ChlD
LEEIKRRKNAYQLWANMMTDGNCTKKDQQIEKELRAVAKELQSIIKFIIQNEQQSK